MEKTPSWLADSRWTSQ